MNLLSYSPRLGPTKSIFNDEALCDDWLRNNKIPLGGISPLEALKTADGKAKVLEMIARIETGDFS
ncbi:TPA: DUF2384 domain-containing protein [Vibrio vulnificus]|nr:MbcA/ParS/Xre antitoxin family protein [Vibrio vulnificus]MCU8243552.1 MbcA/ParS/Xre antitoxin family protein [Vibrio vulnificus]HAS8381571.1 DUF2384 domain-containing protein [Vibrio vulnificus]